MIKCVRPFKQLSFAVLVATICASAALVQAQDDLYFDISVRDGGSATIHAEVYSNPKPYYGVITVLAVHGFTEVGSMYKPLADAIFADPVLKYAVKRIISIDMIAHGLSSAPTLTAPLTFGDLVIEDNAGVIIQSIAALRAMGKGPQVIMGHSMGGIAVQVTQEVLLSQGSSFAQMGVYNAILIGSVPARGTVWTRYPGGDMTPYIINDEVLGTIIDLPVAACGATGGFTTLAGTVIPDAPTPETCIVNDWMAPEPILVGIQLAGDPEYCIGDPDDPESVGLCRPYVSPNAFAPQNGTILTVLGFSQDVLCPIIDQDDLYTYLTGLPADGPLSLFRPIVADDAVHSMFISNPAGMLEAIRNGIL